MLHRLLADHSDEFVTVAYEQGSWVHPQLKYMVVTPKRIDFHLQDDRTVTLTVTGDGELTLVVPPPVQQQYRQLYNVNVVDADVFITLNKIVHVQFQKDGVPVTDAQWVLSTDDDPRLRKALTNRFLKDGRQWMDPIDINTFSIWRQYDTTTTFITEETSEEPTPPETAS
jgi:hypothetical protein|tara:strand:- start:10927 stop:11436 length:510 start_codon:yes stop_codon:yes gene_type:complete